MSKRMTKKNKTYSFNIIYDLFQYGDFGFIYTGMGKNKTIILDSDESGDCQFGWLHIKYNKNYIKIIDGNLLKKNEYITWYFKDYKDIDELCEAIYDFTTNYVNSFKVVRV